MAPLPALLAVVETNAAERNGGVSKTGAGGRRVTSGRQQKSVAGAKLRVTWTSVNGAPMPAAERKQGGIPAEPHDHRIGNLPDAGGRKTTVGRPCDGITHANIQANSPGHKEAEGCNDGKMNYGNFPEVGEGGAPGQLAPTRIPVHRYGKSSRARH